jgi:hypothetical protein
MSGREPDRMSRLVAEELLARIFGDDLTGCPVSLDEVAVIVQEAVEQRAAQDTKLLDLHSTVVNSIHQLATPPASAKNASPEELRSLLSERLDAIRAIALKTIETMELVKLERSGPESPPPA